MGGPSPRYAEAVDALARDATAASWGGFSDEVRERTLLVLFDTLGVTAAGAATPELVELRSLWDPPAGPAPLVAAGRATDEPLSCILNGAASCCLELDEGSKYARGHPCAHVLPAALALGAALERGGPEWLTAFVAGYEAAARFGAATRMHPGVHMHGTWGTAGAATSAGLLLGLDAEQLAAAMDAASAQSVAAHFSSAFRGSFVRNVWVGQAAFAGLTAARLAQAGLAGVDGAPTTVFGEVLGTFDADALDADLGGHREITRGYFKRHAACAYTHPSADAVQQLLADGPLDPAEVGAIKVETYAIATTLDTLEWPTRLAAMFSIPYVVAETVRGGEFGPRATDEERRRDPVTVELARRVELVASEEFEQRLPTDRGARVTVTSGQGSRSAEVRNPIGDSNHQPLGWDEVRAKVAGLIGSAAGSELEALVRGLPDSESVAPVLASLTELEVQR